MGLPGKQYSAGIGYRYGFNGKENDNEVKGEGNQVAFENRIYDPRLGRWFSLDPLQSKYPGESNYIFVSDNPILYSDKDGRDKIITITIIGSEGKRSVIQVVDKNYFEYSGPENTLGGGQKYFKYNAVQSLTIDLRNKEVTFTPLERDNNSFQRISGFEFSQLSDVLPSVMSVFGSLIKTPKSGDNSNKTQHGWRLYGVGTDMKWQNGLPKSADGAEGIDISSLLEFTLGSSPSSNSAELYNDLVGKWMKYTGKDMKQVLSALNMMAHQMEALTDVTKSLLEVTNNIQKLVENDGSTEPRIEPGNNARVDTIPETKKKRDNCTQCGGANMDSGHVNQVARDINSVRKKTSQ